MTFVERAHWDAQAGDEAAARSAVWAEPASSWQPGVEACLGMVEPALGRTLARPFPVVLDLGCGVGRLTLPFAERHPDARVIGVDVSPRMVGHAQAAATRRGNVRFVVGDGRTLAGVGPVDAAWSVLLFQHLDPDACAAYVAEVADRLTPGGVLRFQFVEGDEHAAWSHKVPVSVAAGWCVDAGLSVRSLTRRGIYPEWAWISASAA